MIDFINSNSQSHGELFENFDHEKNVWIGKFWLVLHEQN